MSRAGQTAALRIPGCGLAAAAQIAQAAQLLRAARRVLVTGLRDASPAAVIAACDVAEGLGAAIDTGSADLASPLGPIAARAGWLTADPEELRDRADFVVVWFCDPEAHRPGLSADFIQPPLPAGQPRQVLAVGPEPSAAASRQIRVPLGSAVDFARLLHAALLGHAPPADNPAAAGLGACCRELVAAIRAAACVGFVTTRAADPLGLATWATTLAIRAIAHERPAFAVPLAEPAGGRGGRPRAGDILTWRYGAAGAVACADRLGAKFQPAESGAEALIVRGEVDAVLAVGRLPEAVELALAARTATLVVVQIDDDGNAAASLAQLREALGDQPDPGAAR